jgi:hypothetical protein
MTAALAPADRATAENYVRATLAPSIAEADLQVNLEALLADLYRAADQTWHVDLIEHDEFWAIVWANRTDADNADRVALVRLTMNFVREDMGADEDLVREMMRDQWKRRRAETEHRTFAVPFDDAALALSMTPDEYDRALSEATSADRDIRPFRRMGGYTYNARGLFDVLVLA